MSVTYSSYLKIDELLELQVPLSDGPEHDEMLFIVIHQVYELWFRQTLHELDRLVGLFSEEPKPGADEISDVLLTLRRVLTILKTMVAQIDILETMTPISFSSFRTRLETASGFQSPQFREVEFLLGHREASRRMLGYHQENTRALARLERRLEEPSLYQAFLGYLKRHGHAIPDAVLEPYTEGPPPESAEVCAALLGIYRNPDHRLSQVCERLVDFDEGLQEWRYRHVKMVERTIGTKPGTGGSPGAAYLRKTLFKAVFPDLWNIRADL